MSSSLVKRERVQLSLCSLSQLKPAMKIDKAYVLGETIKQARELKKSVKEMKAVRCGSAERVALLGELDDLNLGYCENDKSLVKVTFSCDDRIELISDITKVVKTVKGSIVRVEMVFIGGRQRSVLWPMGERAYWKRRDKDA
ncbi:Basic helix-loop-helix DNA-binding superfamily protein [Corchorus olitorius]|uniref:Basic helix-loop-helix DNA-binding superfamily protein n=1 Tax=Corchorus olitorius TaxID=93759 RepID=A0A1R3IDE8_9ROSI|nr:Basic helix-loop-helix DNA-binding superfamily protein [Corchorus olitorius]